MELKTFQREALETLRTYLDRARIVGDPEQVFIQTLRHREPDKTPPPYRTIPGLPGVPNVCLRLPTGAGKTLLASHTIAVAGTSYLERDYPVVLWLVPTNTIRKQTAEALKNSSHPYRAAIDKAFESRVSVFDISDVTQIRPQDLTERVSIIVATIQTLRITNTEGRRVYAHSENFEPHFAHIPATTPGLERFENGKIKFSFVNLMAFHQPLVIVDEAHKAGTSLSFEMLASLRPSCVVEFTATPSTDQQSGSNVLFRASAAEAKEAEMIKLPIILTEHPDWRAAIHGAIETRARLTETAKSETRLIRPLVLFQAQDKGQEVTVEVLEKYLMENENIPRERIAIATGEQRELDSINIFDSRCPTEYIITVEALKEGWDCSFAYVLCSVANIGSAVDIEQLLGRVLRMPYAKSSLMEPLNHAYAHVSSPRFGEAAGMLADTLVQKMGFEPDEAAANMVPRQAEIPGMQGTGDLFNQKPVLLQTLDTAPNLTGISAEVTERIRIEERSDGTVNVTVHGDIPEDLEERLLATVVTPEGRENLRIAVKRHRIRHLASISPAQRGEKFAVPRLHLLIQGKLEFLEEELILDLQGWTLNDYPAVLTTAEFAIKDTEERWEVDLSGEKVVYKHLDQSLKLELGILKLDWTDLQLSRWLDRECRQPDITQPVLLEFCRKTVAYLIEKSGIALNDLLRFKYQLAKAIQQKIKAYRRQSYANGYQTLLFGAEASVETSFADGFAFDKSRAYPATEFYQGSYDFKKHFYNKPGELASKGEEFECARLIDTLPQVKYWIRNLSNRPPTSFWLPTSTDRFYPDFIAQLHDGRVFVIEYKGALTATTEDTKEKRNIGELWEAKSNGKGIFRIAEKKDSHGIELREQLIAAIK